MDDSSLPRSLSWTSLLLLTLLAAFAECAILFPDAIVSTRLAAALSWDPAVSGEPAPEAGVEPSMTPAPEYWNRLSMSERLRMVWFEAGIAGWPNWLLATIYQAATQLEDVDRAHDPVARPSASDPHQCLRGPRQS